MKQAVKTFLKILFKRGPSNEPYTLSSTEMRLQNLIFQRRRVYKPDHYHKLLSPYMGSHENLTYADYIHEPEIGDRKILLLRHDIDHDYQTAMKIAEWEYRHGLKATYCVLHTAWYYGHLEGDRIIHTQDLIDYTKRIADFGHEINFHNNLVVIALIRGVDPVKLLAQELEFFHSIGIRITGTSTHGDKLCRKLNFRNWELFKECCDDRFGGPRTISYNTLGKSCEVRLGEISMFDFGLEYEGYDIARDVYHTESGGRLRTRQKTRGRRSFGRKDTQRGEIVGVLTHPMWWDFR